MRRGNGSGTGRQGKEAEGHPLKNHDHRSKLIIHYAVHLHMTPNATAQGRRILVLGKYISTLRGITKGLRPKHCPPALYKVRKRPLGRPGGLGQLVLLTLGEVAWALVHQDWFLHICKVPYSLQTPPPMVKPQVLTVDHEGNYSLPLAMPDSSARHLMQAKQTSVISKAVGTRGHLGPARKKINSLFFSSKSFRHVAIVEKSQLINEKVTVTSHGCPLTGDSSQSLFNLCTAALPSYLLPFALDVLRGLLLTSFASTLSLHPHMLKTLKR
ncbi:hypothetical protein GRJ2_000728900 [Grus japonensis]|uniref:Uncharacterized protein n=1 Tax=Grus japonensis TaxID=30415 RepID=A0ABC9WAS0_GRUJA